MKIYAGFIAMLLVSTGLVSAQSAAVLIGGRSTGMGNASAALADSWAVYNNPAGATELKNAAVSTTCATHVELTGADRIAALLAIPTGAGTFSAGAFSFGDNVYSEQLLSAGYCNSLGLAAMGIRVDYIQYKAEGFETAAAFGVTLGTIAKITSKLSLGCYVANVNRPRLPNGQALPVRMAAGFAFRPAEKIVMCAELEKDVDFPATFKGGLEISPLKKVKLRSGFNLYPNAAYGGIGLKAWRIDLDYSVSFNPALSYAHQATLSFLAKSKNAKK